MKNITTYLMESKKGKEVFTIDVYNVSQEESLDDFKYTSKTYYSEDEAIDAAIEACKQYVGEKDLIQVTVFGGEYEKESGDVLGEPFDIYTVSNLNKAKTAQIRKKMGYTSETVSKYLSESKIDDKTLEKKAINVIDKIALADDRDEQLFQGDIAWLCYAKSVLTDIDSVEEGWIEIADKIINKYKSNMKNVVKNYKSFLDWANCLRDKDMDFHPSK